MSWQIRRDNLIAKLNILNLVPETPGIASSEFLWFRGKGNKIKVSLSSYIAGEVEIEGKGDWPLDKDFYIDRRTLLPWIFASREIKNKNPFVFTKAKKQLQLQHGTRSVLLDTQSKVKGYGDIGRILKGKNSSIPLTNDLKAMLLCGQNCAISDSVVPNLNCVYITKGKNSKGAEAYASADKVYYFGSGKIEGEKIRTSIPFPLLLINLLNVEGLKKISWIGKYVVMRFNDGMIWQPVSQEALESFPVKDIQRHSKKSDSYPTTFNASSRRFAKLITRLGYYLQSMRRQDWVVTVKGEKKNSRVYITSNIAGAHFSERLRTIGTIRKSFEFIWPLDLLQDVFSFLATKTKKLSITIKVDDKHGICYVKTGQYWLAVTSRAVEN